MGKYTSDDNRSMQLNDNNERYYSSRGDSDDDDYYDYSDEGYDRNTGQGEPPAFKEYISLEDWLPYFKVWVQNLKINSGKSYTTANGPKGLTKGFVAHFTGFSYWNDEHRTQWFYYRTRALIDYCTDKNLAYTVMENGYLFEYRVQDWSNFDFNGSNIMAVNRLIYENNGLAFPVNARDLFLARMH